MSTVKADTPDSPFSIAVQSAFDNDTPPNPIPASDFTIEAPVSDNESAISFPSYDPATQSGVVHVGSSNPDGTANIANVSARVLNQDGSEAGILVDSIAVVHGDAAVVNGGFNFQFVPTPAAPVTGGGE